MWWSQRLTGNITTVMVNQSRADGIPFHRPPRSFVIYLQLNDAFD
jgi:hypothetical protein